MTEPVRVGTAKGPGEKPHEFLFITPDSDGVAKTGEFVFYTLADGRRRVIARITGRRSVRGYPDDFLADPDVPPALVAQVAGFEAEECELLEVTASVVGYYDEALRTLVNPRIPPRVGWPIFLAPAEMLIQVLNKKERGTLGCCELGWLLSRAEDEVPVVLSAREFASTHLAIIAGTGAGKSYTAGVIIEELLKPTNKACVLVLDPHGEYGTLDEIQNRAEFRDGAYRASVKCLQPDDLKVRFSALQLNDLRYLLGEVPERQDWLLGRAFNELLRETREATRQADRWTVTDLVAKIQRLGHSGDDGGLDLRSSAGGLEWRLEKLVNESRIFQERDHLALRDLLQPGQCTVIQMHDLSQREQQVIAAVLLRRIYRARTDTLHKKANPGDDLYLPYPVFCLLEEAHTFAPSGEGSARVVSSQVLKQILGEGRKFGIGIGMISQRPGKLDQDVLSQAMTQVIMRIVNPLDQQAVAAAVESASREVLDELPALSKGHAIVLGASLNAPALIQVRRRLTTHGGEDLDAPREWNEFFAPEAELRRKQESAGLVQRSGLGVGFGGAPWRDEDERNLLDLFGPTPPPAAQDDGPNGAADPRP